MRTKYPPGFGAIWTTVAVDLVGFGIVFPLLPVYAERTGVSLPAIGVLVSAFSLAQLVFAPVWGHLSDKFGRRPVLLTSLAGTTIGSLLTAFAGMGLYGNAALTFLIIGRLIDGASGASVSVAQAAVVDLSSPANRAHLLGMLGAAFGVGFVAGPAIGGLGAEFGPSAPFFIAALIAGSNFCVAIFRLPETHRMAGESGKRVEPMLKEDLTRHAAFAFTSKGLWRELLRTPNMRQLVGITFLAAFGFAIFEGTFSLFLERVFYQSRSTEHVLKSSAAIFTVIGILIVAIQGGLIRPVVKSFGELSTLSMGLMLNLIGMAAYSVTSNYWHLAFVIVFLSLGQGLAQPAATSFAAQLAGPHRRGAVMGLQQSASGLGRVFGPTVGALSMARWSNYAPAWISIAVLVPAVAAAIALRQSRHGR